MKKHSDEMFFHIAVCDAGTTNKPLSQSQWGYSQSALLFANEYHHAKHSDIRDLTRVPSPIKCLRK